MLDIYRIGCGVGLVYKVLDRWIYILLCSYNGSDSSISAITISTISIGISIYRYIGGI